MKGSNMWRLGPSLPVQTLEAKLIEDPRGGVILIGGHTGLVTSASLYRLKHGGSTWELMTQQLKIANHAFTAFAIPDRFVPNCTLN
jgi:hypothetical protein